MNPYPGKNSVLIMDNARIHHNEDLVKSIEESGCRILYLPPYSPDLNPIETAFSALKSWLRRYRDIVNNCDDPIYILFVALSQTTPYGKTIFSTIHLYVNGFFYILLHACIEN